MLEAAKRDPQSKWDIESSGSEVEMEDQQLTEEEKERKKKFREWRKKHYNEFYAVKRARELIQQVCTLEGILRFFIPYHLSKIGRVANNFHL